MKAADKKGWDSRKSDKIHAQKGILGQPPGRPEINQEVI